MTTQIDPHIFLGVSPNASPEEIKRAYRRRSRALHPDMHSGQPAEVQEAAAEMFRLLNEAHRTLTDARGAGSHRGGTTSRETTSDDTFLKVRPRSHRAGPLTPGTAVSLTLNLTVSGFRPAGTPRISAVDHGVEATVTKASLTEAGIEVSVRLDTGKLAAHRDYDIPFHVQWGKHVGSVHVHITTGELEEWNPPTPSEESPESSESGWPFHGMPRWRQVVYALYAGLVMPIVGLAWAFGRIGPPPDATWASITGAVALFALGVYTFLKTSGLSRPQALGVWGTLGAGLLIVVGFVALWATLIAGAIALVIAIIMALLGILVVVLIIAIIGAALNG